MANKQGIYTITNRDIDDEIDKRFGLLWRIKVFIIKIWRKWL